MARWDEILSLPVQNPPTLEFSSSDIVWSKVEGWRDNIDRVALIPYARVDDFVRGESANKECPTKFHVEARRRRTAQTSYKPKVDGILEYILYWCSFGPDDHRKGGVVRPSRTTYVPKKKSAGRPNTKRGCTCHFIVKRLIAEPSVALIIYNQDKHVDKKGLPCHGPQDKKAAGTRAMYAPYISEDLRLRVLSLLYVGVSVETIMQRHNESVERQGGPCNRDDLLTHRYVRRQERSIRRSTYELDADDAISISLWVESHQNHIFFYKDFSDSDPFVLGIQTEWQLQQMIRFGNRGLLASDARFGTNKLKYPIHSLVVFNSDNKAIPVAWIIAPRFASEDTVRWMRALYNRVHTKDPTWKLAGFIVDDPLTDIPAIREVFQCSVLISFWRVRHAWHKNLMKRCSEMEVRVTIAKRLGEMIHSICKGCEPANTFEAFMEDFVDAVEFVDYFKATWYPRLGLWSNALRALPLASQETCAALEFYHNQLKLRLLNERDLSVYERADWLVDKLGTTVHSYFWLDEYSGKDDFARYWKDEWISGLTAWRKSLQIPDGDVTIDGESAKVVDQGDKNMVHVIWNPSSEFALCDCNSANMGNLCEHVFKSIKYLRDRGSATSSVSMFQYRQALIKMLHCPPYDSLIRDHALSVAVWVQKQLNSQIGQESVQVVGPTTTYGGQCGDTVNGSKGNSTSSCNGSGSNKLHHSGFTKNQLCHSVDHIVARNGICTNSSHNIAVEIPCLEIGASPYSMCRSEPQLFSIDEVTSTDMLAENGRVLIDTGPDITENLPCTDMSFSNLNDFDNVLNKNDSTAKMDAESQSLHIVLSTAESLNQNSGSQQNGVCGNRKDTWVGPCIVSVGGKTDKDSSETSEPVDSCLVNVGESSNFIEEGVREGPENQSAGKNNSFISMDDMNVDPMPINASEPVGESVEPEVVDGAERNGNSDSTIEKANESHSTNEATVEIQNNVHQKSSVPGEVLIASAIDPSPQFASKSSVEPVSNTEHKPSREIVTYKRRKLLKCGNHDSKDNYCCNDKNT
ncbi:PREDICTED: uncharacterized protein LOC109184506 isoform X1 [Ipomoea nil]|uniref:uncharacterized protein LOC109184506 isoform X1 n=1 Tax=Ipomoea nil TaxID=35883 RepID=UPI000901B6EA|nr:PREDICTED: uncharacterized protein LOC109184506 isoform X1 [Ipomoea nil]XP_019190054.1 PREDICTED: uncharacterized protein LOC109184506 isoform X1 [Ipomoea nil]